MKVYRYVSKKELDYMLDGNINMLGNIFNTPYGKLSNTFKYKKDTRYLHFFLNKNAISLIKPYIEDKTATYYIAEFNIPIKYLLTSIGVGKYLEHIGYEPNLYHKIEFALDVTKFKKEWLVNYSQENSVELEK